MDVEALRTFLAIRDHGGFSAAAMQLGRSQPAISRRIALLEAELGAPLFERIAAGAALSAAGRVLAGHAERILAAVRDAEKAMEALSTDSAGPVDLAIVGSLAGARLTAVLRAFARDRPGVRLSIRTATSAEVSDLVRRGEAMIGIRYLADAARDLECEPIAREAMAVVCGADDALAGARIASLADLSQAHWYAFPSAFERRETFADNIFAQLQARGIGSVNWSAVDSLTAQKRLVEAGFGLALLPRTAIEEEVRAGTLRLVEVADLEAVNPVFVVLRRGGYLSAAALVLLDLLRETPDLAVPLGKPGSTAGRG